MKLAEFFKIVRSRSMELAQGLSDGAATAHCMPQASPAKWHLGHTSWFFEKVVLTAFDDKYRPFDERYFPLFNSYYETFGPRQRVRRFVRTRNQAALQPQSSFPAT